MEWDNYGVGKVLNERYINSVIEVKRVSGGGVMCMKLKIEGGMMSVISAYALQVHLYYDSIGPLYITPPCYFYTVSWIAAAV